jgi:hypothetical protein
MNALVKCSSQFPVWFCLVLLQCFCYNNVHLLDGEQSNGTKDVTYRRVFYCLVYGVNFFVVIPLDVCSLLYPVIFPYFFLLFVECLATKEICLYYVCFMVLD